MYLTADVLVLDFFFYVIGVEEMAPFKQNWPTGTNDIIQEGWI